MHDKRKEEAIFWCHLLYPLIFDEIERGGRTKYLEEIAGQDHTLPNGRRARVSVSTLKRKLQQYSKAGLTGLYRKKRKDFGTIRTVPQEVLQAAVDIKKEQPKRSDHVINEILQHRYSMSINRSTLYRHLKQAGATKRKLGVEKKKVRKRWSRNNPNDLWAGDFSYGPPVLLKEDMTKTYLSVFIDCYSRYVVQARYYIAQNFDVLVDTLLRAWNIHGWCKQIYLDNAKVYRALDLEAACLEIGTKLIHRPVRDPAAGGIIERIILTIQEQFEAEVYAAEPRTLENLNLALDAWLEMSYHRRIHSETGQTPHNRYWDGLKIVRQVDLQKILPLFMIKEERTVDVNYSDVRVKNKFYRVDPRLRGDKVQVYIDRFSEESNVRIYSVGDEFMGEGILYERQYGASVDLYQQEKPKHDYLAILVEKYRRHLEQSIDFVKLEEEKKWPFASFIQTLSRYLGRKGGVSAFTSRESEKMWKAWQHPRFRESFVVQAWQDCYPKNFQQFITQLQKLIARKEK